MHEFIYLFITVIITMLKEMVSLSFLFPAFFTGCVCFSSCLTSAVKDRLLPVSFGIGYTDCIVFCSAIPTSQLVTDHALDALLQTLSSPKSSQG